MVPPPPPEVTYISTFEQGRSDADIAASNLANQKEQDRLRADQKAREEKAKDAERVLGEPLPRPLIDVVQHIILSHHGELEDAFGSAKSPATPEAMLVHYIDEIDAKMMLALKHTRGDGTSPGAEGNWTEYLKAFGGRLYRPDVAPADAGAPPEEPAAPAITNPLFASVRSGK